MQKFYAVKNGRQTGIFMTWDECKDKVTGHKGAVFKSFSNIDDAKKFLGCDDFSDDMENQKDKEEQMYHIKEEDIFKDLKKGEMIAYIDGSYEDSSKYFSYAGIMFYDNVSEDFAFASNDQDLISMRNVAGEVKASMYVIEKAVEYNLSKVIIYYDYTGIENWAVGNWKTNNNLTKSYRKFCEDMSKKIKIEFVKVKSHTNIKYNEYVDKLAKKAIKDKINFL